MELCVIRLEALALQDETPCYDGKFSKPYLSKCSRMAIFALEAGGDYPHSGQLHYIRQLHCNFSRSKNKTDIIFYDIYVTNRIFIEHCHKILEC